MIAVFERQPKMWTTAKKFGQRCGKFVRVCAVFYVFISKVLEMIWLRLGATLTHPPTKLHIRYGKASQK